MIESHFERAHICHGRDPIRVSEPAADLEDNAPLWEALWSEHRELLLAEWIGKNPGTRPQAWWLFDDTTDDRHDDESEVEYLARIGELQPDEIEAIRSAAEKLASYNRSRHPNEVRSNFVAPSEPVQWAINAGLVSEEVRSILNPERARQSPKQSTNGFHH